MGKVLNFINKETKRRKLHFSLIDPDPGKITNLEERIKALDKFGTDAYMVGGSTNVEQSFLDSTVKKIKAVSKKPVILFPGGLNGVSKYADAIFFMSLMNSRNPNWIVGKHALGSLIVKEADIEPLSMGYLIIEPGMKVGKVGEAELKKHGENSKAAGYALAAQYLGMSLVYLEAGSGAYKCVPPEMISAVKSQIKIPLIVGGGIRSGEAALTALKAGADIVVTGTVIENSFEKVGEIISMIRKFRKTKIK